MDNGPSNFFIETIGELFSIKISLPIKTEAIGSMDISILIGNWALGCLDREWGFGAKICGEETYLRISLVLHFWVRMALSIKPIKNAIRAHSFGCYTFIFLIRLMALFHLG
ncbi:hypothetical protein [Pedobacter sp. BMA]|uniref:hypothetical protein n=1 Tax=Pedobacter sp. BMA TaxID=1663685 RepID=UPI0012E057EA|nr:hypothetical protein [Pedobacter sp. BMA]